MKVPQKRKYGAVVKSADSRYKWSGLEFFFYFFLIKKIFFIFGSVGSLLLHTSFL